MPDNFNHTELFKGNGASIFKLSLDGFKSQIFDLLLDKKVRPFRYFGTDFETAMKTALGQAPTYPALGFRIESVAKDTSKPNAKLALRSGIHIGTDEQGNNIKVFPVPVSVSLTARYAAQTEAELLAIQERYFTLQLEEALSFNLKPRTRDAHHTTDVDVFIKVVCLSDDLQLTHPTEGADDTGAAIGSVEMQFRVDTMFSTVQREKRPEKIILEYSIEGHAIDGATAITLNLLPTETTENFRA